MLDETFAVSLRAGLRGDVLAEGDPGYEAARAVYNGMIDLRPRLIARCADVADVTAAVSFGRNHGLAVAVRGGGHNGAGFASVDDGLVIDLSRMNGVRVDPAARTVRVGPGCTQGDVDHATHAFGLAVPAGIVSTTGIAGLTLGGGHGYLARRHGLTIDSLLEADVVLADGRVVTASASADGHPDLFWRRQFRRGDELPVPRSSCRRRLRRSGPPTTSPRRARSCGATATGCRERPRRSASSSASSRYPRPTHSPASTGASGSAS